VRPVVDESRVLDIEEGWHPVIADALPPGQEYITNSVRLDPDDQQIIMLTGPNMSGKSALLRQTALIVILAQCGSFVPAKRATIGLVDRVFTRVGASDNISLGESTFMVEMTEAASILNNLSARSLILLDEIGRGTSTYDGISIAWAMAEYIHDQPKARAKTLFATHYHELNEMAKQFERIRNYSVSVREYEGKIIFLRKLVAGGSEHSFGIHVAKLAGMPPRVVQRANAILAGLEAARNAPTESSVGDVASESQSLNVYQVEDPVLRALRSRIASIDVDNLTPLEALNQLHTLKLLAGLEEGREG
jgi:DNA mismatch repair protein mutS